MVIYQTQMIPASRSYQQSTKQQQSSGTQTLSSSAAEVSSDSKYSNSQLRLSINAQRSAEQQQVNQLAPTEQKNQESVTITTSIGHTESNQHLNKQQAIAIYQKIASLI